MAAKLKPFRPRRICSRGYFFSNYQGCFFPDQIAWVIRLFFLTSAEKLSGKAGGKFSKFSTSQSSETFFDCLNRNGRNRSNFENKQKIVSVCFKKQFSKTRHLKIRLKTIEGLLERNFPQAFEFCADKSRCNPALEFFFIWLAEKIIGRQSWRYPTLSLPV